TAGSANDITLDAANNFGGVVTINSGRNVTLNDTGAINLGASTISGNLAVTANGSITDSGALSIAGTTSLTAGSANDITLDAANNFGGAVSVASGKNVTLNDTSAIDLGASTISGNLTVTAGGAISSSGTVTAGNVSATTSAQGISLTLTADSVTAAAPGSISISQVGNQSVTVTSINSTAGNITLSTDGTTAGQGMTIDTLVANGGAGRVTLSGGVEFSITNNTTYTQSDISAATLNLSAATLLGSIAGGYNPPVDQTYDIINTSATTTAFSNAANGVVFGNVAFAIDYTGNVTLTAGLPTLVYVDDLWAGSTPGQQVSSGSYTGTFGYNAFATISAGVAGVATTGVVGVIEGLYNESITVSRDVTIEGIQPAVPTTEMGAAAGTAMLDGTGLFTAAITASGAGIDLIVSNLQFSEWINGAVLIQGGAAATLTNVTVVGELAGVAASFGVRLQGAGSSLTLDKSIISAGSSAGPNNGVQVTGGTFTMTNSSVSGSASAGQVGVALTGGTAIVSNSFITGNFLGLTFSNTATGTLSGNDLTGNSAYAVRNGTVSSTINASGNWWGAITESGVLAKTFSTGSSGSRVDISPYLLDGTGTGNATAGFQGDFSQLAVTTLGSQAGANAIQEGVDAIANGTLSGVNRILLVNSGTYSGATDVNQSLTLTTSEFTLTDNLTISADIQAAEVTGGGGTAITVNGAGNNLATNANLAFTGTGTLALKLGSGSIAGPGVISASALTLSAANGSINVASDAGTVTLTSQGDATIADVGAIDLAASTIGGNLAVTANGSITDSGVLNVTGSTSLAAGSANDITLDAANNFGGAVGV
ncbi:MAG: beta strand repeat-containing protein, partial [Pirellulales bacterium]